MKINIKKPLIFLLVGILLISGASCKSCHKHENPGNGDSTGGNPTEVVPTSVEIVAEKKSIAIGETLEIKAVVTPENASQEVVWEIKQEENYVKFENGILTGLKEGKVYISCSCKDHLGIFTSKEITVTHPLLDLDEYKVEHVMGGFGTNASTDYEINYHCKNLKTSVLVTKASDTSFSKATKYIANGVYFEDLNPKLAGPFTARNVMRASIKDLTPGTEYIYKIDQGDGTYTDVYHFKTADKSDRTTFLFNTDTHYSMLTDGSDISTVVNEELVDNALKMNPNIQFILDGGDLIDTGGNANIWEKFFGYAQCLKKLPFMGVPGNHEYYVSSTLQMDFKYFAINRCSAYNGPDPLLGASCYFKHNDTLFILIDNNKGIGYYEQYEWMTNLLENEDYKYSVICFHAPVDNDNSDYDAKLVNLFQKYSVDLVLDGHYHVHSYKPYYIDGKPVTDDEHLGVTYLTGACSGVKGFRGKTHEEALAFARGYIVDICEEGIKLTQIDASGRVLAVFNITTRKSGEKKQATKDELFNKLDAEALNETNQVRFTWDDTYYKNVVKVSVEETLRNKIHDYSVIPTPSYTSLTLNDIVEGYDYNFKVTIKYEDGEERVKYFNFDRHDSINLTIKSQTDTSVTLGFNGTNESMNFMIKEYKIYVDGSLYTTIPYLKGYAPCTETIIANLVKGKTYEITFEAIAYNKDQDICYKEKIKVTL